MSGEDRRASEALQIIAGAVEDMLKMACSKEMGFCLVVFPTETNSRASYISNCDRPEVIEALKTLLGHWGEGMPDITAHEVQ
mgnify:CR=1 FL=1|tara:strand:- start:93 stop:338 length:246 start_codon:yes stop_codon:yes gene_type:complete